jgi:hypothetical protein
MRHFCMSARLIHFSPVLFCLFNQRLQVSRFAVPCSRFLGWDVRPHNIIASSCSALQYTALHCTEAVVYPRLLPALFTAAIRFCGKNQSSRRGVKQARRPYIRRPERATGLRAVPVFNLFNGFASQIVSYLVLSCLMFSRADRMASYKLLQLAF